jgi:hypothetical protein
MTPEEDLGAERPRAVTVIGRLWLVVAVLLMGKALVNLSVWTVLKPDLPTFIRDAMAQTPQFRFLRPLLVHLTAVMLLQVLWWIFVGVAAFALLRLRPWARVAIQGVCCFLLVYSLGFEILWAAVWPTLPARSAGAVALGASYRTLMLVAGLTAATAVSAGLVWMIVLLRGPGVRAAFKDAQAGSNPAG